MVLTAAKNALVSTSSMCFLDPNLSSIPNMGLELNEIYQFSKFLIYYPGSVRLNSINKKRFDINSNYISRYYSTNCIISSHFEDEYDSDDPTSDKVDRIENEMTPTKEELSQASQKTSNFSTQSSNDCMPSIESVSNVTLVECDNHNNNNQSDTTNDTAEFADRQDQLEFENAFNTLYIQKLKKFQQIRVMTEIFHNILEMVAINSI